MFRFYFGFEIFICISLVIVCKVAFIFISVRGRRRSIVGRGGVGFGVFFRFLVLVSER